MKKTTYEAKLAKTIITDENTVAEAKKAQKVKTELNRFWKKEALAHVLKNDGIDLVGPNVQQIDWKLDWKFNLKTTGAIVINVTTNTNFGYNTPIPTQTFRVLKRKILT